MVQAYNMYASFNNNNLAFIIIFQQFLNFQALSSWKLNVSGIELKVLLSL